MAKKNEAELPDLNEGQEFDLDNLTFSTEDAETKEESIGNLGVGIHENLELVNIQYITPKAGQEAKFDEAIDFTYADEKGNQKAKRLFLTKSKLTEQKMKNLMGRLKHILNKYLEGADLVITGKNFKEIYGIICDRLGVVKDAEGKVTEIAKAAGVKVAIKVIMDNEGRGLGNIPDYMPFVVPQERVGDLKMSQKEMTAQTTSSLDDLNPGGELEDLELPGLDG